MPRSIYKDFRSRKRKITEDEDDFSHFEENENGETMGDGEVITNGEIIEDEQRPETPSLHELLFDWDNSVLQEMDADDNIDECDGSYEGTSADLTKDLLDCPDNGLQFVASVCLSRLSQQEYNRFLSVHDDDFEEKVQKIWNCRRRIFSTYYICNSCGKSLDYLQTCCGFIVKFVRNGIISQLHDIVSSSLPTILSIRKDLKSGSNKTHNLYAPFFSTMWKSENEGQLQISGVLSIDGVSIPGNSKKLWPISIMILDLSTSEMQKSSNIILEGIAESVVNPSTHFWNAIYPILMADSERPNGKVGEYRYNLRIVTTSSDQPAKRSLFGFRAHHSSLSCFYCMAPGTFYKTEGAARHEARPGKLTIEDSKYGRNGFSNIPSKLVERILPFENPIDILHDAGEGLFNAIMTEMFGNKTRTAKSTLFSVDSDAIKHSFSEVTVPTLFNEIHNCRNGTDKINFFRLIVCCSAIQSTLLSPKARFVCVSLACVTNKMYTNAKSDGLFDVQLCAAARWFLKEASEEYMTCKAHEFIYHLPYSNQKFGNSASLSTFCFESSYQYNLMGYSSRLTRNFCETACSRVLLHNTVRREIVRRAENNPSRRLQKFLSATTGIVKHVTNWQTPIGSLKEEDIHIELTGRNLYSTLSLSFGTLRSEYFNRDTPDDLFFASQDGDVFTCFRFIACGMKNKGAFVLAEPLEEIPISEQFDSLHDALQTLSGTDYYYGQEVLKMMQSYEGIKYCSQTGKREIIPIDTIISVACYIPCSNGYCVVAINGSPIHN